MTERSSARDRLLAAANELFYREGVHTVGIDRVIERAGVAKASLYSAFGSKDELICEYLRGRHEVRKQLTAEALAGRETPRERLLAVFDSLRQLLADPGYHGCAFQNASAEASVDSPILRVTDDFRRWVLELFTNLSKDLGVTDPIALGRQLQMLYDGANTAGRMDHARDAGDVAKAAAAALIDAAK